MDRIETPSGKDETTENFPVAKFIRSDLRAHVTAYYIFARAADDISDNPLLEPDEKVRRLDAFGRALLDDQDETIPSVIPLRTSLKQTSIDPVHALDLLVAFKQDEIKRRYETFDDLLGYCRFSAAPVGRYVLALHGIGQEAWKANDSLCNALQILNHIQDCADDYRELDRVYLPLNLLDGHGSSPNDLSAAKSSEGLHQALTDLLDLTLPLIQQGALLYREVPDRMLRLNTAIIGEVALALDRLLRKRDPLYDNVKLSRFDKMMSLIKGTAKAFLA